MARQFDNDRDLHNQQDKQLADRIGKINPNAGLSRIPLRVKTEVVSSHERRETIVKND